MTKKVITDETPGSTETVPSTKNMRMPPPEPYLQPADLDYLVRMNMELLAELWITRDRLAVVEELMVSKNLVAPGEVDSFAPGKEFADRLERLRATVVENVLGAPFKNNHTVETLKAEGRKLARLHEPPPI